MFFYVLHYQLEAFVGLGTLYHLVTSIGEFYEGLAKFVRKLGSLFI